MIPAPSCLPLLRRRRVLLVTRAAGGPRARLVRPARRVTLPGAATEWARVAATVNPVTARRDRDLWHAGPPARRRAPDPTPETAGGSLTVPVSHRDADSDSLRSGPVPGGGRGRAFAGPA